MTALPSRAVPGDTTEPTPLQHAGSPTGWITTAGPFTYHHHDQVESADEAQLPFEDLGPMPTPAAFLGVVLHLIQQCGGELRCFGLVVEAEPGMSTDGAPLPMDARLIVNGQPIRLGALLRSDAETASLGSKGRISTTAP